MTANIKFDHQGYQLFTIRDQAGKGIAKKGQLLTFHNLERLIILHYFLTVRGGKNYTHGHYQSQQLDQGKQNPSNGTKRLDSCTHFNNYPFLFRLEVEEKELCSASSCTTTNSHFEQWNAAQDPSTCSSSCDYCYIRAGAFPDYWHRCCCIF